MEDIGVKRVTYTNSVYSGAERAGRKGHIAKQSDSLRPDMVHHVNSLTRNPYLETGIGTIQNQPLKNSNPDYQRI
jgi:hypothetical protein